MQNAIKIHVNGEARICRSGATVEDLLRELDLKTEQVAVELNLEILERATFSRHQIKDGDRVEIMSFIGGGSF